jgi:hypothetical protein
VQFERRTEASALGRASSDPTPWNPPNKAPERAAEVGEGRERTKGNSPTCNAPRTQSRTGTPSALARVRQAATPERKQRFTALLHHVYEVARLRAASFALTREAVPGLDGETWRHYGEALTACPCMVPRCTRLPRR